MPNPAKYAIEVSFDFGTTWEKRTAHFSDIVFAVIDAAGKPLRIQDIISGVKAYWQTTGATPAGIRVAVSRMAQNCALKNMGDGIYDTGDRHWELQKLLFGTGNEHVPLCDQNKMVAPIRLPCR